MHLRAAGPVGPVRPVITSVALLTGTLVALTGTTAEAATTLPHSQLRSSGGTPIEAETAPAVCTGTIDSDWTGFSGSGFCNGTNSTGGYAQFTVSAAAAGTATLNIRFANGTTTARAANVVVNGSTVASVSFQATGAWSTWATKTLSVPLQAG